MTVSVNQTRAYPFPADTLDGPFTPAAGSVTAPAYSFAAETTLGLLRAGSGTLGLAGSFRMQASASLQWATADGSLAAFDLALYRDSAAGVLAQRNGTNAQRFRVYETYTDASNNAYGHVGMANSRFEIASYANGTGTLRDIYLFADSSANALIIDTSGNVEIASGTLNVNGTPHADVIAHATPQIFTESASGVLLGTIRTADDTDGPAWYAFKGRASDGSADTIVQNGDRLLNLSVAGADGASFQWAARIAVYVDGTPGVNDMPGRIEFQTSSDGSASPSLKWGIDNAGLLYANDQTSSSPALKRSGANLQVRLADDSGYSGIEANTLNAVTAFTGPGTVAGSGAIRLANNNAISFRDFGNTADVVGLTLNGSDVLSLYDGAATLTSAGALTTTGAIQASSAGGFELGTAGDMSMVRGGSGRLQVLGAAAGVGVTLNVATDGVLNVYTRGNTDAATINASAYQVGGTAGASFGPGAVTSITVVNGIVTAIS